jgi:hypothetical protein
MRKWGIVVTLVYAAILIGLLTPAFLLMGGVPWSDLRHGSPIYSQWVFWVFAGVFILGEATLLFLSVDASHKRLKPRTHLLVSCVTAALFTAVLAACTFWSLGVAAKGEDFTTTMEKLRYGYGLLAALWMLWAGVFYFYLRNSSAVVTRLTSWLLKGSVLELLIAVPCHVIVRRRTDCSAPFVSGFGIASGLAIMLLSFGPGVLLLYKKRLDAYPDRAPAASAARQGRGAGSGD